MTSTAAIPMVDWIAQYPLWAGLAIFLASLAESLAVVGVVIPGALIMFGAGTLIALGTLELWDGRVLLGRPPEH
jgi:membrane protein DedA with SNARE-associated domain